MCVDRILPVLSYVCVDMSVDTVVGELGHRLAPILYSHYVSFVCIYKYIAFSKVVNSMTNVSVCVSGVSSIYLPDSECIHDLPFSVVVDQRYMFCIATSTSHCSCDTHSSYEQIYDLFCEKCTYENG